MLLSAFSIAQGLGARTDARTEQQKANDKAAGRSGDDVVGAARLGLWCGVQLLGTSAALAHISHKCAQLTLVLDQKRTRRRGMWSRHERSGG